MARKGATRRSEPGRRPGTPAIAVGPTPTTAAERALLVALALGAALGLVILYVHAQLVASEGGYTSFCNVSSRVNCDVVLTSAYGTLLGVPVAAWALLTYAALAVLLLVRGRTTGARHDGATLLLVGLAVWSLVFSLYMAAVAAFAIGALCLLCSGLYVVNAIVAVLAWRVARATTTPTGPLLTTRRIAIGAAALAAALAVAGGSQLVVRMPQASHLTAADVQAQHPEFYNWYASRPIVSALPDAEHVRGDADAPITIVEFSDFECRYCAKAFDDIRDLERRHPGTVRVVFHHFPLDPDCNPRVATPVHRLACRAAIAAECAAHGGRFWEYHDWLFEHQQQLGRDDLIAAAVDLGIDRSAFAACLDDPTARARVVADAEAGAHLGVTSTPTLFINGRTVEGAPDRGAYEWMLAMERHG